MTKYMYYGNKPIIGMKDSGPVLIKPNGVITAAYKSQESLDQEETMVSIALSFCSPKDQFNKKRGRTIAEGRLNKRNYISVFVPTKTFRSSEQSAITAHINEYIFDCLHDNKGTVPRWMHGRRLYTSEGTGYISRKMT